MRSVLTLSLLIGLFTSTGAAAREHYSKSRQVVVRSNPATTPSVRMVPSNPAPSGVRIYRDDNAPGGWRTYHDDPPAFNDRSKFGGG